MLAQLLYRQVYGHRVDSGAVLVRQRVRKPRFSPVLQQLVGVPTIRHRAGLRSKLAPLLPLLSPSRPGLELLAAALRHWVNAGRVSGSAVQVVLGRRSGSTRRPPALVPSDWDRPTYVEAQ